MLNNYISCLEIQKLLGTLQVSTWAKEYCSLSASGQTVARSYILVSLTVATKQQFVMLVVDLFSAQDHFWTKHLGDSILHQGKVQIKRHVFATILRGKVLKGRVWHTAWTLSLITLIMHLINGLCSFVTVRLMFSAFLISVNRVCSTANSPLAITVVMRKLFYNSRYRFHRMLERLFSAYGLIGESW